MIWKIRNPTESFVLPWHFSILLFLYVYFLLLELVKLSNLSLRVDPAVIEAGT
jgi:hypothetical protein